MSNLPLPDGWIQQHDANYNHTFWVSLVASHIVDARVNVPLGRHPSKTSSGYLGSPVRG